MGKISLLTKFLFLLLGTLMLNALGELSFSGTKTISMTGSFQSSPSPAPCFTDWDGDGNTDLLAAVYLGNGDTKDAAIQLYLNKGTNTIPDYQFSGNLQSGGSDIVPYFY